MVGEVSDRTAHVLELRASGRLNAKSAGGGPGQACQNPEECRFPGAVSSEQSDELAGRHRQIQVAQR
jgi:hypothetical protein